MVVVVVVMVVVVVVVVVVGVENALAEQCDEIFPIPLFCALVLVFACLFLPC